MPSKSNGDEHAAQIKLRRIFIRLAIVTAILWQCWLFMPRFGSYSSPRILKALVATESSPKSVRDAALAEAERQDRADDERKFHKAIVIVVLTIGIDVALIYFLWNYGVTKRAA
jgi:hypothetical protein